MAVALGTRDGSDEAARAAAATMKRLQNGLSEQTGNGPAPVGMPTEGGTILVVDDNQDEREALAGLLGISGYQVCTATDGADALRVLDSMTAAPSLILLDLEMPRMTGWELLDALRADESRRPIPVIVTSGSRPPPERLAGVTFFPKPLDVDALLVAVRSHCARAS